MERVEGWEGRAYPGHGDVVADGRGRVREYIAHRRGREGEVLGVLAGGVGVEGGGGDGGRKDGIEGGKGVTAGEIVKVVYKDVPVTLHEAAERGVLQILAKLEGEGRVKREGEKGWRVVEREKGKESL